MVAPPTPILTVIQTPSFVNIAMCDPLLRVPETKIRQNKLRAMLRLASRAVVPTAVRLHRAIVPLVDDHKDCLARNLCEKSGTRSCRKLIGKQVSTWFSGSSSQRGGSTRYHRERRKLWIKECINEFFYNQRQVRIRALHS